MTRAEVTLLIQQQQQLPLSACLCMCGVCGADHIGWLGEGDLDLESALLPMAWHMSCAACRRTAHGTVWIQSSGVFVPVVRGGKSLLEMGRGDGDCPSFTPRLASICCCFSTAQNRHRTLRTCSSAKGKRLGMAWHGMAWRAVLFAWHVGVQILPRASPRGSWCFMPSSRHPVHLSQDSTSIWPVNQTNLHQMGPGCFLRACPSWEPSACMSRAIPKLPSTSQKGADGGGGGGGGTI